MKNKINVISFLKKSIQFIFKAIVVTFSISIIFGIFYWYNNRLFLWEASLIWTQEPFSESKFKADLTEDRAKMSVDLIQSKKLIGIESNKIHDLLGKETGDYYYSDANFTYRLTNRGNADWILTLVTGEDGKIERIFIRKSCCSISRRILYLGLDIADPIIRKLINNY